MKVQGAAGPPSATINELGWHKSEEVVNAFMVLIVLKLCLSKSKPYQIIGLNSQFTSNTCQLLVQAILNAFCWEMIFCRMLIVKSVAKCKTLL